MAGALEKAVKALAPAPAPAMQTLPERQPVAAIPAQRGIGKAQAAQAASASGGSSSLTGVLGGGVTLLSSDGLFSWVFSETVVVTIGETQYKLPVVG